MWEFYFRIFIHRCLLFHLNFLETAELIGLETVTVVLVSLSPTTSDRSWFNIKNSIVIYIISCGVITVVLHILQGSVRITLTLRGRFSLGLVGCNVPFPPTTIASCVFMCKTSCSDVFIFSFIARLLMVTLLFLIEFRIKLMIGQKISCCHNGLWVLVVPQRKLEYKSLEECAIFVLVTSFHQQKIHSFLKCILLHLSCSECLVHVKYSSWLYIKCLGNSIPVDCSQHHVFVWLFWHIQ